MKTIKYSLLLLWLLPATSCEEFVQVNLPDSYVGANTVFANDQTAISVTSGMYRTLLQNYGLIGGTLANVTFLTAMSADEVAYYNVADPREEFVKNDLTVNNSYLLNIWAATYKTIYEANTVIEGSTVSTSLSQEVAHRIRGEALFIRALCHFYLVNLFGAVPVALTTDYRVTSILPRTPVDIAYQQIKSDLENAERLLSEQYVSEERTRPNKSAATAMRARVALYQKDYALANVLATSLINQSRYKLESLDNTFLTISQEAIWQLSQVTPHNYPTGDAFIFTIQSNFFQNALSQQLVSAFEPADERKNAWVGQWANNTGTYWFARKYKERLAVNTRAFKEYHVVLRLAEQYFIRAEARVYQGDRDGAIADLNEIRLRAGLAFMDQDIPNDELLQWIQREKRIEFFCEMGHRWLDLKRTGKSDQVLASHKPGWSPSDALYPIPEAEMLANPFLKPQNPGY